MSVLRPTTVDELLAARADNPDALLIAGGTDVMVALNGGRLRPRALIDTTRVAALRDWSREGAAVRLGAGVTYARLLAELAADLPGLAMASRTVGSPQIRNRGTIGGNVATSSPAGDALPPLVAAGAEVEVAGVGGTRRLPIGTFLTGPKRNALAPDEVLLAIHVPAVEAAQQFAKIGTRNAMVIAVASLAIDLVPASRAVGVAIGSAGPTTLRAPAAEAFLAEALDWERCVIDDAAAAHFGELAAAAARPIDDVRGTAAYRRHAVAVMARRTLSWALQDLAGRAAA